MNKSRTSPSSSGTMAATPLTRAQIEGLLGTQIWDGDGIDIIQGVTTWDCLRPNRMIFVEHFNEGVAAAINHAAHDSILVVAIPAYARALITPRLICSRPRDVFAKIVRALFRDRLTMNLQVIHPSAIVHPTVQISSGVVIGAESSIGEETVIHPNVVVSNAVHIGSHCVIKSGTVIGQTGFGIYKDEEELPQALPHVAGVVIGNHVELGALNTIASGAIHPTIIEDYVKTDDHVHIAHNCYVGTRSLLTACVELSGSVRLGTDCWLGPNSSIRDGIEIGDRAFIGIGSVVTKSFPPDVTAYGVPARSRINDRSSS